MFSHLCLFLKEIRSLILLSNYQEWEYNMDDSNWVNTTTGELLSEYKLPSNLKAILSENINLSHH